MTSPYREPAPKRAPEPVQWPRKAMLYFDQIKWERVEWAPLQLLLICMIGISIWVLYQI